MKNGIIKTIKKGIKERNLFSKILILIYIKLGYTNEKLFPLELRNKNYLRLKKKYSKFINSIDDKTEIKKNEKEYRIIWILWLQGIDNAPDIVKNCFASLKIHNSNCKIILLDKNNLSTYISLPENLIDKWERGIISNIHMSDIIRIELLINHGGVWVDSTCFFTDDIPSWIFKEQFFSFKSEGRYDRSIVFESWFIYSKPQNPLLLSTRKMLYEYWSSNNYLCDYFLLHIFFTIASEKHKKLWDNIPFYTDLTPHLLAMNLFKKYDNKKIMYIKKQSFVHKLNYKNSSNEISGTFYEKIIKGELF